VSKFRDFGKNGYMIVDAFQADDIDLFASLIIATMNQMISEKGLNVGAIRQLDDYHLTAGQDDRSHQILMNPLTRYIEVPSRVEKRAFEVLTDDVFWPLWGQPDAVLSVILGHYKNGRRQDGAAMFRISRPATSDSVAVHIDNNYGGMPSGGGDDVIARPSFVTLWIPIIGHDEKYTLRIAPDSHRNFHPDTIYDTSDGRITMEISDSYADKFNFIRPNLAVGQALVLHPNLLHGKSTNIGDNTRVSVEFRIFDKLNIENTYENLLGEN
jgi:hypothetical protein